jgi:acetyl esterase/lipase
VAEDQNSETATIDGATLLAPDLAELLRDFPAFTVDGESLPVIRDLILQLAVGAIADPSLSTDDVERHDHEVPGSDAIVRSYRAKGSTGVLPGVFSIHGGGYVLGDRDMDDVRYARWCPALDCVGFSVEYRLAPETPYPGALEDCYAGLGWVHEHHEELGVDPDRIGITGVSAGGGLAAALALLARDRGELPVAFQALECPMVDDRQQTVSSQLDGLAMWTRESNSFGWRAYLGDRYGTDDVPPTAAPARATDLRGLPPAIVSVGGADGFRDEDIEYALRLGQAGVPTELHVYPGAPHGISLFPGVPVAAQWNRDLEDWLSRQLRPIAP